MLDLDSIESREDFKWDLIHKAFKDPAFGVSLKKNPLAVLEQEMGKDAARSVAMEVHQEAPKEIYFLINYNPGLPDNAGQFKIIPGDNPEEVMVKKAWKDPTYRRELLGDPAGKFKQEFGRPLPGNTALRVLEEGRNQLHLILPTAVLQNEADGNAAALPLTDAELDQVSGGGLWAWLSEKVRSKSTGVYNASGNSGSCGCMSASGVRG